MEKTRVITVMPFLRKSGRDFIYEVVELSSVEEKDGSLCWERLRTEPLVVCCGNKSLASRTAFEIAIREGIMFSECIFPGDSVLDTLERATKVNTRLDFFTPAG